MQGKHNLELNWPGDGRLFLNFWDWAHGNDVACEVVEGKLMLEGKEITFQEYIQLVTESIEKRSH